jgi:GNAT superfamily N-acetyltransferase
MNNSKQGAVIQGNFPRGLQGELARTIQPRTASPAHRRPPTYEDLTLQAHRRSSGQAAQPVGHGSAFLLPSHLTSFGRHPGQPLPPAVQRKMESFFGADFSDVQVHVGPEAHAIGALAFTQGSHIYFAPGQYNPASPFGQQILGHELTHVMQQRAGRVRNPYGSGIAVVHDRELEAEADRMGRQAALHQPPAQSSGLQAKQMHLSGPVKIGAGSYKISAASGGREIGSVSLHDRDRSTIELTDLGVDQSHRGDGVGQGLLGSALREGLRLGKTNVTLGSQDDGSGRLTKWYRGMGFRQVGVDRDGWARMQAPIHRVLSGITQARMASSSVPQMRPLPSGPKRRSLVNRAAMRISVKTTRERVDRILPARRSMLQRATATGGAAPSVAPTVYVLTATEEDRKKRACGGFTYQRSFRLSAPAPPTGGIIVQKVERQFVNLGQYAVVKEAPKKSGGSGIKKPSSKKKVLKIKLAPITPDLVNPVSYPTWTRYWEIFEVPGGATELEYDDAFTLSVMSQDTPKSNDFKKALIAKNVDKKVVNAVYSYRTKGKFIQTGEAVFYPTNVIPPGFVKDPDSPAAGLLVTRTDPSASFAALTGSNTLSISVTAEWDSKYKNPGENNYGEPKLTIT